jgi:hypothetical protein
MHSWLSGQHINLGWEEYIVVAKGNVRISFGGEMLIFLNVYYVPGMELNLLSINQIMRNNPG